MSANTPGPWTLQNLQPAIDAGGTHGGPDGSAFRIYGCSTLWFELRADPDGYIYGQNEANARLIAAAPDMFDVLQEFKIASDIQDNNFDGDAWLKRVDAAIKKVTSQAS